MLAHDWCVGCLRPMQFVDEAYSDDVGGTLLICCVLCNSDAWVCQRGEACRVLVREAWYFLHMHHTYVKVLNSSSACAAAGNGGMHIGAASCARPLHFEASAGSGLLRRHCFSWGRAALMWL